MKDDKHTLRALVDGDTLETYEINKKVTYFTY